MLICCSKCCDARLEKCKSVREVEAMFGKHRLFLIASMITGKEGLQWTRVPLHGWLHDTYPVSACSISDENWC